MPDKNAPPANAPTDAEAREAERKLFEGLAGVKMFPMDPSGPVQTPGQMLPLSNVLRNEATQPAPQPEFVGPIEQAMRAHPGLTRAKAEEMAEAFGFSAASPHDSQPETVLARMTREFIEQSNAAGRKITVEEPPLGPQPLIATFHKGKRKPTSRKSYHGRQ